MFELKQMGPGKHFSEIKICLRNPLPQRGCGETEHFFPKNLVKNLEYTEQFFIFDLTISKSKPPNFPMFMEPTLKAFDASCSISFERPSCQNVASGSTNTPMWTRQRRAFACESA